MLRHPPGHVQRSVAYFLSLGNYEALIRRMGRAYQERRNVLDAAIAEHGLTVAGRGTYGGSSVWMRAPVGVNTNFLSERLRLDSVLIEPGAAFFAGPEKPTRYYRLAYSSIPSHRIRDGLGIVARAIRAATP